MFNQGCDNFNYYKNDIFIKLSYFIRAKVNVFLYTYNIPTVPYNGVPINNVDTAESLWSGVFVLVWWVFILAVTCPGLKISAKSPKK